MTVAQKPLAFIDVETTGRNPLIHEIVEIAILVGDVEYHSHVRPRRLDLAEPWSLEHLTFRLDAPAWEDIEDEVVRLLEGTLLCGHNVAFDEWFITSMLARTGAGRRIPYHKIDTVTLAIERLGHELESVSLAPVARSLGVVQHAAHTALDDARVAREVYRRLTLRAA